MSVLAGQGRNALTEKRCPLVKRITFTQQPEEVQNPIMPWGRSSGSITTWTAKL